MKLVLYFFEYRTLFTWSKECWGTIFVIWYGKDLNRFLQFNDLLEISILYLYFQIKNAYQLKHAISPENIAIWYMKKLWEDLKVPCNCLCHIFQAYYDNRSSGCAFQQTVEEPPCLDDEEVLDSLFELLWFLDLANFSSRRLHISFGKRCVAVCRDWLA